MDYHIEKIKKDYEKARRFYGKIRDRIDSHTNGLLDIEKEISDEQIECYFEQRKYYEKKYHFMAIMRIYDYRRDRLFDLTKDRMLKESPNSAEIIKACFEPQNRILCQDRLADICLHWQ